ncbi:MAG: LysR family transcriptional regulator [Proteobacteria bacterium]|nr:MAG: LysR family transcriptional regulator [Pseudomonadota bacterium]
MELRWLQSFVAMYEEGSVSRAGRRLNIVQPAISTRLAKLESELGNPLFQRTPRGLVPTRAGHEAYRLFLPILRSIEDARQDLTAPRNMVKGHVAVGVVASVAHNALSETLIAFSAKYPHVTLRMTDGYTRELLQMQRAGQLDLVVINALARRGEYQQIDLICEEFALICSAANPVPESEISFRSIDHHELVIPSPRHGLRTLLDEAAEREGIRLSPRYEFDEIGMIERFVAGTGFRTILPPVAVAHSLRAGRLRCVPVSPQIMRHIVGVHHATRPLSRAATVFVTELRRRLLAVQQELTMPGDAARERP